MRRGPAYAAGPWDAVGVFYVAALFAMLLTSLATRYGYHRDEMYFLAAGRHLDWAYPDQPVLTPLLARAMSAIDPDSLLLLRAPAILAATVVVICAGFMAREFGGGRGAQALAAGAVACSPLLMGAGHMLNTEVFDLAAWSVVGVLVLRLMADGAAARWWPAIGIAVGIGLENKLLLGFSVVLLVLALVLFGPRKIFATKYFPIAVGIAVLLWLPWLIWQARNGWPQLEMGRAIAGGSSSTSNTPIGYILLQFGLMGPLLVPMWAYGLWWLWRNRSYRAFAATYVLMFLLYLGTGGKAYYLGGMYPILLAAASVPLARWLGTRRIRWAAVGSVAAVSAVFAAILFLPVLPLTALRDSPVLAINHDVGETVGWPEFVRRIGDVRAGLGPDVAIVTGNYGEAGAIERFGAQYHLPTPHSGHNAYWWWGPPSDSAREIITVGLPREGFARYCNDIELAGTIDNAEGIKNNERGKPIYVCHGLNASWSEIWPKAKHLG
ncbi:ArnT family glycosyltransferase [Nocardia arthritidis]|uniref:Glycosyltransferase RgtA/B/C/D-like domain-containing protein n=1 Tax=Nocardia arthritidis TaxID=228602 RepID=A0A6G9YPL0_9NOCA|nr:glycosyltransferase family 39 protein [Nocardia arthritidis]QIS15060.1 hypothetical protein F5544_36155 [Nocardia arthritidis]